MIKYNKITDEITGTTTIQRLNEDGSMSYFPMDEANSDYQAYLNPDKMEHLTEIPTPDEA